jgi:hypothetical protein
MPQLAGSSSSHPSDEYGTAEFSSQYEYSTSHTQSTGLGESPKIG